MYFVVWHENKWRMIQIWHVHTGSCYFWSVLVLITSQSNFLSCLKSVALLLTSLVVCISPPHSHNTIHNYMYTLIPVSWYSMYVYSLFLATFSNPANCTDGEIRLFGGSSPLEGRVEICANRAWGTVCGQSTWRFREANVVCRQLGYSAFGELGSS